MIRSTTLTLILILTVSALAVSVSSQNPASTTELTKVFHVDPPFTDAAVLMDASLSMRGHRYHAIRQTVIDFASSLTGKDTLHIRVFGDVTGTPLEGPADKIAGNVAVHLPTEPMFHHTDLGMAIQKGLEFLERYGAGELQVLLLLTDGAPTSIR